MQTVKKVFSMILAIFIIIATLCVCISVGEKLIFAKYFWKAEREFRIPGLFTSYTPQGFDYLENEEKFILSGYDKNDHTPIAYIVDEKTEDATRVEFLDENGQKFKSHSGGICHYGNYFYMTNELGVDMFYLSDVLDGNGTATKIGRIETDNIELRVSCCNVYDGVLYLGEFYIKDDYETPESHRIGENTAIMAAYTLGEDGKPISSTPDKIYSIRGQVQGMCLVSDGNIALSTSYGLAKSRTCIYNASSVHAQQNGTVTINGVTSPLYILDEANKINEIVSPPMAEEIVYKDGKLYILTESACMRYLFGKIMSGNYVYSYEI